MIKDNSCKPVTHDNDITSSGALCLLLDRVLTTRSNPMGLFFLLPNPNTPYREGHIGTLMQPGEYRKKLERPRSLRASRV